MSENITHLSVLGRKYMKRRVVITGLGAVTPFGTGIDTYWDGLKNGKSATRRISSFDPTNFNSQVAGEVIDFNPTDFIDRKSAKRLDRFSQFMLAAGKMALEDSKLDMESIDKTRAGSIIGCGIGGIQTLEKQHTVIMEKGPSRVSPFLVPMMISNMAPGNLAIMIGLKGINFSVASACASGTHAIGECYRKIANGEQEIMFGGGVEAAVTPLTVAGFGAMKALSTLNDTPESSSRPFDKTRAGFVIAEGGGVIVLEEYEHAIKRGAKIYAEIVGYGATDDAFHITQPAPEGEGAYRSMELALQDADIKPEQVTYINAHGTSTHFNDLNETKAIKALFGEHAKNLKVSSTKSMIGHLLGASGAVESVAVALMIEKGIIHPTINYNTPDEECDLDYVPNKAIEHQIEYALSNSFGFGGHNGTLVFKKFEK
jgi:3-oxoacyl-[acyl-carrier-protein] synthase II